ncbi:sodium/hydrogen exchanger 9B1-like isoform X1 [Scaptodrosophila lebanonensis]|uniref:Sodium/hydrogen exchanger 9B1-like isoform X1 n=1 Tax=Drosophila lebanonensis TaxID=7225 RepID=A0A6J2TJ44_DROLE|nr:sodium/hydrogen exchanger 9B1-like isoform X1 [Scaptodrosophila lebanonensis]
MSTDSGDDDNVSADKSSKSLFISLNQNQQYSPLQLIHHESEIMNTKDDICLGDIKSESLRLLDKGVPKRNALCEETGNQLATTLNEKAKDSTPTKPHNKVLTDSGRMADYGDKVTTVKEDDTQTKLDMPKLQNNGDDVTQNSTTVYAERDEDCKAPKWWSHLLLRWPGISESVAILVIFLGLWSMAWVLLQDYAKPSTVIMRIVGLFVGAQFSGILVTFLNLPDMLGMLFFGVLYTNVGLANFEGSERLQLYLREMALVNIMLLAGLGLDGSAFKRLWIMIMRLTFFPTIAEVAIIALLAYFTLHMSWLWAIALGLVITAVSPNVVVTVMLKLKEERLGLNNGIHTLIYAMTTCNDVVSIFLFGLIISVIFSTGSLTEQVLQGPIGIGIGLAFGYLFGLMLRYLPSRNTANVNSLRFVLTFLGGTLSVMGSRVIGYPSAGALGCVSLAFTAGIGWKQEAANKIQDSVPGHLDLLWKFLKPVSFALIGKEIKFSALEGPVIGYGALLVVLGSLFRLVFAYLSTYGRNLSKKERAYITISGVPKATVQAALGPVALDMARAALEPNDAQLDLASNVLIISVLAIIFTAPLGAILMLRLAPLWLERQCDENADETANMPENNSYKNV